MGGVKCGYIAIAAVADGAGDVVFQHRCSAAASRCVSGHVFLLLPSLLVLALALALAAVLGVVVVLVPGWWALLLPVVRNVVVVVAAGRCCCCCR